MKKIQFLLAAIIFLYGCSSVSQPTAKRALVEHDYVSPAEAVAGDFAQALAQRSAGDFVTLNGVSLQMGSVFFAATGLLCRNVVAEDKNKKVYCQRDDKSWFEVNRVIAEYKNTELSEAK